MSRYNPSPDLANVPAGVDEVEEMLAEEGKPLSDRRKLTHFLGRVLLGMKSQQQTLNRMHQDLGEIQRRAAARGGSSNADPRYVAQFLTPEQKMELVRPILGSQIDVINQLREDAAANHRALVARVNRLRFVVESLLDSPDMPESACQALRQALEALPEPGEAPTAERVDAPDVAGTGAQPAPQPQVQQSPQPQVQPQPAEVAPEGGNPPDSAHGGGGLNGMFS